ncbi:MAG TPA: response regulator, partial [Ideonella sp.]|nr:response regulator [Ideonella sp.]
MKAVAPGDILVVDDVETNRRLLSDLLSADGHRVRTADDGEQALAIARAQPPDLVLLDVLMPGMDGFSVCRALRADPLLAAVAVLMVTTLDAKQDRIRGLDAGADDFLSKPIMRAELQARVRSLLRVK